MWDIQKHRERKEEMSASNPENIAAPGLKSWQELSYLEKHPALSLSAMNLKVGRTKLNVSLGNSLDKSQGEGPLQEPVL